MKANRMETRLSVRASREELTLWNATAREFGHRTVAGFFRSMMTASPMLQGNKVRLMDELKEVRLELSRIGNNVNQIAHRLNGGDGFHDASDNLKACLITVKSIDRIIHNIEK